MIHIRLDVNEDKWIRVERQIPTGFNPGEGVPISISIIAKAHLHSLSIVFVPPKGLELMEGEPEISLREVKEGTVHSFEYIVQTDGPGSFDLRHDVYIQPPDDESTLLSTRSVLSSGFVYSKVDTELYSFECWINPASAGPGDVFPVPLRVTAKVNLPLIQITDVPPPGFEPVHGETEISVAELLAGQSSTHTYTLRASDETGIFEINGKAYVEGAEDKDGTVGLATPLYVFPHLAISSLEDPAWRSEVGPRLIALVNSHSVNQHLFLANGLRLAEERGNVEVASAIRPEISLDFFMPDFSGIDATVGGVVSPDIFIDISQGDKDIYPVREVILVGEDECNEADDCFNFSALNEFPEGVEAGATPGARLGAEYDTVLQVEREVFNLGLRLFVNDMRATNQDSYTQRLPLGSVTVSIDAVEIPAIRPSSPPGQVFGDASGSFNIAATGLWGFLIGRRGNVSLQFNDIGIALPQTPGGVPTGIKLILTALSLGALNLNLGGVLGWLLGLIAASILRFGIWVALRFIRSVDVPIWPLVDAFTRLGLAGNRLQASR